MTGKNKCKKIQELIITDYLDDELDMINRQQIEQHLRNCPACQKVLWGALAAAKQPFENQQYLEPPESVWTAIREQIAPEKKYEEPALANIKYTLRNVLFTRRAALAMIAAIFTIIIAIGILKHPAEKNGSLEAYFEEQLASYIYLQNANADFSGGPVDFGTALEKYFL